MGNKREKHIFDTVISCNSLHFRQHDGPTNDLMIRGNLESSQKVKNQQSKSYFSTQNQCQFENYRGARQTTRLLAVAHWCRKLINSSRKKTLSTSNVADSSWRDFLTY